MRKAKRQSTYTRNQHTQNTHTKNSNLACVHTRWLSWRERNIGVFDFWKTRIVVLQAMVLSHCLFVLFPKFLNLQLTCFCPILFSAAQPLPPHLRCYHFNTLLNTNKIRNLSASAADLARPISVRIIMAKAQKSSPKVRAGKTPAASQKENITQQEDRKLTAVPRRAQSWRNMRTSHILS